jgi:hypothetical protein
MDIVNNNLDDADNAEEQEDINIPGVEEIGDLEAEQNDDNIQLEEQEFVHDDHDSVDDVEADMDPRYGQRSGPYELRPRQLQNYDHIFVNDGAPLSTSQMNMSQGIAMFREEGVNAIKAELAQLHDRKVMNPKYGQYLTRE